LNLSRVLFAKRLFLSCVFRLNAVKCVEIHRKIKKCETNFASFLVKNTTTFVKVIYTFV
jgi:hypothetical protein